MNFYNIIFFNFKFFINLEVYSLVTLFSFDLIFFNFNIIVVFS